MRQKKTPLQEGSPSTRNSIFLHFYFTRFSSINLFLHFFILVTFLTNIFNFYFVLTNYCFTYIFLSHTFSTFNFQFQL